MPTLASAFHPEVNAPVIHRGKDNGFKERHFRETRVLPLRIVDAISLCKGPVIVILEGVLQAVKEHPGHLYLFSIYDGEASIQCCYYDTEQYAAEFFTREKPKLRVVGKVQRKYAAQAALYLPLCIQVFCVIKLHA